MQIPGKTIKKIAILQTMDAIKFTDLSRDTAIPRALCSCKYDYHIHAQLCLRLG